ncbi:MAG: 50S ribosomal protein L15 [Candidatus Uhrbacteria bacterium GW2011_GWF2_41_16]|jgi:large subunit ribosomal protein L15|uniref:Large ribosomal subunit protein uL15 n=2 Tax=Candidatus Uhriibacteriota TaxID=1752732 RepID=A0A0G0VFU0_9BACT|nr:MAG: 50S ribosomal protein L15 [Candidatus Uhrbacteria bacterium GW2011_GWA2_41_10]KKR87536.1 MAG: 50S ribosomal protein L15 [Candidatus Uhrbacteria bacterium GW2011_GWC2_41_11]KKR98516.1 MAG: 50S ribosomal protein L15 [Candidatus Uhrbacteria bacterium GW2011_GWF2_41_16]
MTLALHTIKPAPGSKRQSKRVGRGLGSRGSYSGRGVKGQRARSGGRSGLQLKGLRSLMLKLPKQRGFRSLNEKPSVINVQILDQNFTDGEIVQPKSLLSKGLVDRIDAGVKILGAGELKHKIIVKGCTISASAKEKIEKVGGSVL